MISLAWTWLVTAVAIAISAPDDPRDMPSFLFGVAIAICIMMSISIGLIEVQWLKRQDERNR